MAYYRDWGWLENDGAQGADGELTEFTEALATVWLRAAAEASDPRMSEPARRELAILDAAGEAQSPMRLVGSAVAALARIGPVAKAVMAGLAAVERTNLYQVDYYVNNKFESKRHVLDRVAAAVENNPPKVVIGHSLGSIVAYEAIHRLDLEVDLFVTIGSPLGISTLIAPRVDPAPSIPAGLGQWLNFADPDDPIAAVSKIAPIFGDGTDRLRDVEVHNVGFGRFHHAISYLRQDKVRRAVWEALT